MQPVLLSPKFSTNLALIMFNPSILAHGILRDRTVNHPMPRTVVLLLRPLAIALSHGESSDRLDPSPAFHLIDLFLFSSEQLHSLNQEPFNVA